MNLEFRMSNRASSHLGITLAVALIGMTLLDPASGQEGSGRPSPRPPNIVFIMTDDMGWADLGCFGGKAIPTPNLDAMAAQGMRFTQAYSGCVVCAPARSTLMTGSHMGHTSVRLNTGGVPLLDDDVTVAELLKRAGTRDRGFRQVGDR